MQREQNLEIHSLEAVLEENANLKATISQLQSRNAELEQTATIDFLTRIDNRATGFSKLETELKRSLRHGTKMAVVMVDIDEFKKVNDTERGNLTGHPNGDRILVEVADMMKWTLREEDVLARFGGEEILIVLTDLPHDTNSNNIIELLEQKLLQPAHKIKRFQVPQEDLTPEDNLTLSMGVVLLDHSSMGRVDQSMNSIVEELIDLAIVQSDKNLYSAKHTGKNKAVASPLIYDYTRLTKKKVNQIS